MIHLSDFEDKHKDKTKEELIRELYDSYVEKEGLEEEKEGLRKEKEKLENELKKYENGNTPSSANKHMKKNTQGLQKKKGAKRGAPKGHKGNTLNLTPEEIIDLYAQFCNSCNSQNIKPTGHVRKKEVICYQKPKVIVKQFNQTEYVCLDCKEIFAATRNDIPEKGIYDKSIQSIVNYYKFKARLPYNLVVDVMNNIHKVPMTEPTAMDITQRVSDKLEPKYKELEEEVKQSDVLQGDETSHSVDGVNHWIWVFCNHLLSLFKFTEQRGGDIVEETLGPEFEGKFVSDGWSTYACYTDAHDIIQQRCVGHLRREVKHECKTKHPHLYKHCCDIITMIKKGKRYKQAKRRRDMHARCKNELFMLIEHMKRHRNLRKLATKIENGGDKWLNCILYPELPMDNNESERSLRPFVVMRKIIGCLRSEKGVRTHEVMMSLMSTWQKQGNDPFYTLQNKL